MMSPRAFLLAIMLLVAAPAVATDLYVDYSATPDPANLLSYNLCILSPEATVDLAPGRELGNQYLGYLSLVEVAGDALYRKDVDSLGIKSLAENTEWNSHIVDITDPAWETFVVQTLANQIVAKGFDGFFLDTVDSYRTLEDKFPERKEAFADAVVRIITALRTAYPDKAIVMNRGFAMMPKLSSIVDGVLVESVFRTVNFETREFDPVDQATSTALQAKVKEARGLGYDVYVIDYVSREDRDSATEAAQKIREIDAVPFLTTPDLQGVISGAVGPVARKILVLFGHDPEESESFRIWPADTTATKVLQTAAEWMGYEFIYHDVSYGLPPEGMGTGNDFAGVILDEEMDIPYDFEQDYCDWLLARVDEGKKALFLGSYAFSDGATRLRLFRELGIRGNDGEAPQNGEAEIAALDPSIFNFEREATPQRADYQNLQAPAEANVLMAVSVGAGRYDTAYHCDWGGALMSPYVTFEASEETILSYADPFKFLEAIWPRGGFPAPDPSTRDGLRVFYTHVDGDGFSSLSQVEAEKTCAEVLYDRFLKDAPWPITISIVEAELRGHTLAQKPGEREQLEPIARKIFALPQVEPASHSYSHPYIWLEDDASYMGLYDSKNMELKLSAKYPKIDTEREILGSLDYINSELTPKDKPAKLILWSGNCRPSPEALRLCEENGILNMNGGETILSHRFEGIAAVAPRVISWDGHLQIYAANQNEFMYTNGWEGPYFGGFGDVTETFEMTESPRRLKPVNVYYHFYSVERHDSTRALQKIYDWCNARTLRPMLTTEFALATRDSHLTRISEVSPDRFVVQNEGHLRTLRLPISAGYPDMAHCEGVIGYRLFQDEVYIATDGSPRVTITMAPQRKIHPRVISSTSDIIVETLDEKRVQLRTLGRAATIKVGGYAPGSTVSRDDTENIRVGQIGQIEITLPASTSVELTL